MSTMSTAHQVSNARTEVAPLASYAEVLGSCAGLPDDFWRAAFFMLTTLVRPWELVSAARVAEGQLHVPQIPYGCARSVPLGHFAGRVVGEEATSLLAALGVRAGAEVDFLAGLQRASKRALSVSLEQLWAGALAALVEAAPSALERSAVFAYAGLDTLGAGAGLVATVPALIDAQVRAGGFE